MTRPRKPSRVVQCTGKEALEQSRAKSIAQSMRNRDKRVDAYRCNHCGAWHVGSHSVRRPRRIEKEERDA